MARYVLGISAWYHDSAAALVRDGEVIAAAQQERFSRVKHDARFPAEAVEYCLAEAGIRLVDVELVSYYEKPFITFERLLSSFAVAGAAGLPGFLAAMPEWLGKKLWLPRVIREQLGWRGPLAFAEHHQSHAASAFYGSPFEEAAILTCDGVGEWTSGAWGVGDRADGVQLHAEQRFPHSLGLLYSAFTWYCGFRVNFGEYKLMGLAPYGRPTFKDRILEHLIDLKEDGSFRLDQRYFGYLAGRRMTSRRLHALFDGPPRTPESELDQRVMDLAASVQAVTEEVVLRQARHVHAQTGQTRLCMAGGVALNCVANGRLLREGPFDEIWIQPAAGDAGGALGAAWVGAARVLEQPIPARPGDGMSGALLGPAFSPAAIARALSRRQIRAERVAPEALASETAALLEEGQVVGWFQGRMEYGPRALGARSILADPRGTEMQSRLNQKIKFRETFRPFAPLVLEDRVADWFQLDRPSRYMLLVAPVAEERRVEPGPLHEADDWRARLQQPRSQIQAVTHVDMSARVQTVPRDGGRLGQLLAAWEQRTGCPVLINTSFNVRGEPIVCTPDDALRCFLATDMDALVLGDWIVRKPQPDADRTGVRAGGPEVLD